MCAPLLMWIGIWLFVRCCFSFYQEFTCRSILTSYRDDFGALCDAISADIIAEHMGISFYNNSLAIIGFIYSVWPVVASKLMKWNCQFFLSFEIFVKIRCMTRDFLSLPFFIFLSVLLIRDFIANLGKCVFMYRCWVYIFNIVECLLCTVLAESVSTRKQFFPP